MDYSNLRLEMEESLGKEIYEFLEGDIIKEIIREAKIEKIENNWKFILEGHSFKVSANMAPSLYNIFDEVTKKLNFKDKVDFYVTNNAELNAFAISRLEDDENHLININSGLIDKLNDDELKFIIGHEIGHLYSKNAEIMKLIQFVFPDPDHTPIIVKHKLGLWDKLSELTADRFGYIACSNLEVILSVFFKLASGLDTKRINFDYKSYLESNDGILEFFNQSQGRNLLSHPINPIRIKSLELFSKSKLISKSGKSRKDKNLEEEMEKLIDILMVVSSSEIDMHRKYFLAAGGLIMANVDAEINKDEYEQIVKVLSGFTIFPKRFINQFFQEENIIEIFHKAADNIIEINPSEKHNMLGYLVDITLADKEIFNKEIVFLYEFGTKHLGFTKKEVAQIIADIVQKNFMPKVFS